MAEEERDEEFADEILGFLREDEPEAPKELPDKTIRTVQALMTSRDIIDLTTVVFVLRFCAPLIELIAEAFGATPSRRPKDD